MQKIPVLITGCHGELGSSLIERVSGKFDIIGIGRDEKKLIDSNNYEYVEIDLLNRKGLKEVFLEYKPRFVINCAAITNVDKCEKEKELCWKTNVEIVQNIIYTCKRVNSVFIHISTDYVFDGKNAPYSEDGRLNPLNYYGKSKLASENLVKASELEYSIIRTSTLYSARTVKQKNNFTMYLWRALSNGQKVKALVDEIRNPTLTENLADGIWKLINLQRNGIYHIAGKDIIDRYSYASEFAKFFGFDESLIESVSSNVMDNRAPRPENSGLLVEKAEKELFLNLFGIKEGFKHFKQQLR